MTTDWNTVLSNRKNVSMAKRFANGNLTGRDFYSHFANTSTGGEVRTLLRGGVDRARTLTRKALTRRELV